MPKQVAVFAAAILLATVFFSPAADKLWTGAVSTDWFEPNNWNPPGVPSGTDAALIPFNGGANLLADVFVHQLVLADNASISGPGNLTATNLICTNAWLRASGSLLIPTGGIFRVEGDKSTTLERHLYNDGLVVITASNAYIFDASFNIYNRGAFEIQGERSISASPFSLFQNSGVLFKSGGEKTNSFGMPFVNSGEMRLLSGTLRLSRSHTNEGTVNISDGATLEVPDFPIVPPSCSLQGFGTIRFGGNPGALNTTVLTTNPIGPRLEIINAPSDLVGSPTVRFDSAVAVRECLLDGGGISGSNTVTITNFIWAKGWLGGNGTLVIPPSGSMMVTGIFAQYYLPKHFTGRTLVNYGNVEWRDSGTISSDFRIPGLLVNRGTFRTLGDGSWGAPIVNEGLFIRSGGTGQCAVAFRTNTGVVELRTGRLFADYVSQLAGELYLNGGDLVVGSSGWRLSGGVLRGGGTIFQDPQPACDNYWAVLSGRGEIQPGNPIGVLNVGGHAYIFGTRLTIEVGGTNAGIDHDQIVFARETRIEGAASLSIVFVNGFQPVIGQRFEVARFFHNPNCAAMPRQFSLFSGMDLGNGLVMLPEYSSTNLTLVVTNMPDARFYVVKDLDGIHRHHIRYHGSPPKNYILQGSTTLTNWVDLFNNDQPIDFIDYVNDFWNYQTYAARRFYRVRWNE